MKRRKIIFHNKSFYLLYKVNKFFIISLYIFAGCLPPDNPSTFVLSSFISNAAVAVFLTPVALYLSGEQGIDVDAKPLLMAVCFGASASFISPFGYQTNLMVYSAGNYRLKDYIAMGLPLSIIYSITVLTLIPLVFPFQ